MVHALSQDLKQRRTPGGIWRGKLSSSAISTSVSIFALYIIDKEKYAPYIQKGNQWLIANMTVEGSWGDTTESPSNLTATLLSYASLYAQEAAPDKAKEYLSAKFGGNTDEHIIEGVLAYYGKDLTFSAPILVMCALAGVISSWDKIPRLPFELSVLPQRFFRFLNLPVVSYAIPALIAVGILRHKKGSKNLLYPLRESFINPSLRVLEKLQPENGGYLEAAPLTAFVSMCMSAAGYRNHITTGRAAQFLTSTIREDGSWPIDTDLAGWVTSLSVRALEEDISQREALAQIIRNNAFKYKHPFTGAQEGGWGWTDLSGSVPDADDTAGALVALHILQEGNYCDEIGKGIEWLLDLQNNDGGMPTFCKGWGKLPFDRSSADISAHTLLAFSLWHDTLPPSLQQRCTGSMAQLLSWMKKEQATNGSWTPLWFGDQEAANEQSPVYGTAVAIDHLSFSSHPLAQEMISKGVTYLLAAQNEDGGWGGAPGLSSRITLTSKAINALTSCPGNNEEAVRKGVDYLYLQYKAGQINRPEPIGLYFARLWYSEELYNITFTLTALKNIQKSIRYSETKNKEIKNR